MENNEITDNITDDLDESNDIENFLKNNNLELEEFDFINTDKEDGPSLRDTEYFDVERSKYTKSFLNKLKEKGIIEDFSDLDVIDEITKEAIIELADVPCDLFLDYESGQVCFEQYEYNPEFKNFWLGSKINFSGTNADYFYNLVKKGQVNWTIFKEVSLSRFDIHYFRQSTSVDSNQQVKDFMESACNRIREKSKRRKVSFDPTREPYILKVGSRSSSNFYRVYQKTKNINRSLYTESTDGLEFELEVKKDVIKSFQQFLFNNQVEEFEKRLTQHFFNQSKKPSTLIFTIQIG